MSNPALPRSAALALICAAATVLAGCNLSITNQAEGRSEWKETYTLAAGGSIEIRNSNGLIDVQPGDGTEVSVTAERIAHAATDDAARDAAEHIDIREDVSPSSIVLDAKTSLSGTFRGQREVKFHVRAPKGTALRLSNTNGAIEITNMTGELKLDATNGAIKALGISGTTHAETTNGGVVLDFSEVPAGGISAETTNGAVSVTIPRDAHARINAHVSNGGIEADNLPLQITDQSRRTLDATLNGGGPEIRLETTNGGVRIKGR